MPLKSSCPSNLQLQGVFQRTVVNVPRNRRERTLNVVVILVIKNKLQFRNTVLSYVYVIQCENINSQLSESAKKFFSTIQLTILKISHLNDKKCQTLAMLKLNVIHQDTRTLLTFNTLFIIHNNCLKKWLQDVLNFTTTN